MLKLSGLLHSGTAKGGDLAAKQVWNEDQNRNFEWEAGGILQG